MSWDEDSLDYGYVLARPLDGGWWHLHFGRSDRTYQSGLLGRRTDILASVQRFSAGAMAQSVRFLLTLDGEGVEVSAEELVLDCRWDGHSEFAELTHQAQHLQQEIMPLLKNSPVFQMAAAEIVARQRYLQVIAPGRLRRAEPSPEPRDSRD